MLLIVRICVFELNESSDVAKFELVGFFSIQLSKAYPKKRVLYVELYPIRYEYQELHTLATAEANTMPQFARSSDQFFLQRPPSLAGI